MKNVLISTGGSGGHVLPASIIFEHLKDEFNLFISSDDRGIKFLGGNKNNVKIFNTTKLSKNIFILPFQIILLVLLTIRSFFFLKKKKIEILISTGGYMSLPLCMASKFINIKLFLYEPNMTLGRSNKFFINSCVKIFCYSNEIKNFPNRLKHKICIIPPLLRKKFYSTKVSKDITGQLNLLIIGGSQGAKFFNTIARDSIIKLSKKYKLKIFQQTNYENYDYLKNFYLKNNIENELFDFNEDIANFMCKSNLCITRGGASTLAELVYLNVPHIVIPLPSAKDNHQFENASFYQRLGCNWVLNQKEINHINLVDNLINIVENKAEYLAKKNNMRNFNYQNKWHDINRKIIKTINEN